MKETKLSLFVNDMITYVEDLKESTKIPRTNELSKVTGKKDKHRKIKLNV